MMPEQQIKKLEQQLLSLYQQATIDTYSNGYDQSLLSCEKQLQQAEDICQKLENLYQQYQPA